MLNPSNYILDVGLIFSSYHVLQIWPYFDVSITFLYKGFELKSLENGSHRKSNVSLTGNE